MNLIFITIVVICTILILFKENKYKDLSARIAIQRLANEINREVYFFQGSENAKVFIKDVKKHFEKTPESKEVREHLRKNTKAIVALAEHFGLEVKLEVTPATEAKSEVKIIHNKKSKK